MVMDTLLAELIALRRELHRHAELADHEFGTRQIIRSFLVRTQPGEIFDDLGGTGLAAVYDSGKPGKTLLFRADIDALPIDEGVVLPHASGTAGVAHKCGHDGHAAVLCGLAALLKRQGVPRGKVVLVFQPAEETGTGAARVLADDRLIRLAPDWAFAFHNLPGYETGSVVVKSGPFASASRGMIVRLTGRVAHAATPENGVNPALALAEIIQCFQRLNSAPELFTGFVLTTIIHASLGERAFGTSAGQAEILATLRSHDNRNMARLGEECLSAAQAIARRHGLGITTAWADEFTETRNHPEAVSVIERAAGANSCPVHHLAEPMRWSEDFGQFTARIPGAMFGLGAGRDHAALHAGEYDFPDEIIGIGVRLLARIGTILLAV
ncbi:MAG TPA: amidohydrolase [Candidatus Aminicenantes bacterium]|nr:amidohydrolase [Candidatus Aminicenantes bacterium]